MNTWKTLNDNDEHSSVINFDFQPLHVHCVMTEYITGETRPTDCFIELFSETVLNYLVDSINSYTEIKIQQNEPAK